MLDFIKLQKRRIELHPCYSDSNSIHARIHLPVAAKCNVQCNYCSREYDCPNETRPGVTSKLMTPEMAFQHFKVMKEKMPHLTVAGIAGPGDALANFEQTQKTFQLIHKYNEDIIFCMATNGLMLPEYASELLDLHINHITVTINAIDPLIAAKIYKYIIYKNEYISGLEASKILLANQLEGLNIMIKNGVVCKVNIVAIKGINDLHITDIVNKVKNIGVYMTNIMPLIPVKGTLFESLPVISNKEIDCIRDKAAIEMKQMYHCRHCRADACGTLCES